MNRRLKIALLGITLVVCTAFITAEIVTARAGQDQKQDQEKMMKMYLEMAKPGKPHKELTAQAGAWEVEATAYMGPEASTSKGIANYKSILGGRFLVMTQKGEMGGMPFEGFQILGYDNVHKEYVSLWLDNWSTGMHFSAGTADKNGVVEMKGSMKDAMTPDGRPFRSVWKPEGADKFTLEMYDTHGDKEIKVLEAVYTRKK